MSDSIAGNFGARLEIAQSRYAAATGDSSVTTDHRCNPASTKLQIAAIVADLLGLEKVEDDDNFFMLGGHSLLGTQLIMRVHDAFGVDLSLRTVFTQPTVAGISAELDRLIAQ